MTPPKPKQTATCARCGATFVKPQVRSRFCSAECSTRFYGERANARRDAERKDNPKECLHCKRQFLKGQRLRKFCSRQCCIDYHNETRQLAPNVFYKCKICGKDVARYVEPCRQTGKTADTLEYCDRTCAGIGRKGENHPMWNGGRRIVNGYVQVYSPDHPNADQSGYMLEHRLVMERHLGRLLTEEEVVHHENEKPADNRIENLVLCENQSEHKKLHDPNRRRNELGQYLPRD